MPLSEAVGAVREARPSGTAASEFDAVGAVAEDPEAGAKRSFPAGDDPHGLVLSREDGAALEARASGTAASEFGAVDAMGLDMEAGAGMSPSAGGGADGRPAMSVLKRSAERASARVHFSDGDGAARGAAVRAAGAGAAKADPEDGTFLSDGVLRVVGSVVGNATERNPVGRQSGAGREAAACGSTVPEAVGEAAAATVGLVLSDSAARADLCISKGGAPAGGVSFLSSVGSSPRIGEAK